MKAYTYSGEKTRDLLLKHYRKYPLLRAEDIFKYLFQSAFGCEHLVSDLSAALNYIKKERESTVSLPTLDELDGEYTRVHISCLAPETLAKLFCLSAKKEEGLAALKAKLEVAKELVAEGSLPIDGEEFAQKLDAWRTAGYPALHHSEAFRAAYHPAYRVIANKYAKFLSIFAEIDSLLANGNAIIAIEGGAASGKTTLAGILAEVYDCNVFHMDDFFLRPEQRTPERFAEIGGNVDRERFLEEVLEPLKRGDAVCYRPFDCGKWALGEPKTVELKKLTVVEGVYSMHPDLADCYDYSVYLDISPEYQRERIQERNSPAFAKRFFEEWIPLENRYFEGMRVKERCCEVLKIEK
jgi:thymidylate kinase